MLRRLPTLNALQCTEPTAAAEAPCVLPQLGKNPASRRLLAAREGSRLPLGETLAPEPVGSYAGPMSFSFVGPNGGFERRWIVYALLRDNVQHHLEGGAPSPAFAAIHSISEALGAGPEGVKISGAKLKEEVAVIQSRLASIHIDELAVSLRTRAVITRSFPLPTLRATELARLMDWSVPFPTDQAETVGSLFEDFLEELMEICGEASDSVVCVIDS